MLRVIQRTILPLSVTLLMSCQAFALDLNNGRVLASNCTQCHSTNVLPKSSGFDSLKGESYSEIYGELKEFQSKNSYANGTCTNSDSQECLMGVHAMPYSDAQMQDLAWYLAQP